MCPPAIVGGLKFLAPIILPQLMQSLFGGDKSKAPKTHAAGLATKSVKQVAGGEDVSIKEDDKISEAERAEQAKNAARRKMLGTKNLDKKKAPGTDTVTGNVEGSTDTQSGINLGGTTTAGAY